MLFFVLLISYILVHFCNNFTRLWRPSLYTVLAPPTVAPVLFQHTFSYTFAQFFTILAPPSPGARGQMPPCPPVPPRYATANGHRKQLTMNHLTGQNVWDIKGFT